MKKLTHKEVKKYMEWRTDEQFRHCPIAAADACNELFEKFHGTFGRDEIKPKDFLRLLFFNDPIPSLNTHSYGFNTATGRNIIQTLQMKYYEYERS